jgi:hypothetical protein
MEQVESPPEAQGKRSAGISRVAPVSHRGRWGVDPNGRVEAGL